MPSQVAFIAGATGTQGGAVARYLLSRDIPVHAVARTPTSPSAQALASLGVTLVPGDFDNKEALAIAMKDCTSIFLNLMPSFTDPTAEMRWVHNILNAGRAAGVKHVVYSSGFGVDRLDELKQLDQQSLVAMFLRSKRQVEKTVQSAGFEQWTILRPGNFMANFLSPMVRMYDGLVEKGVWTNALTAETTLPMVDTTTVGAFGGESILNPDKFNEKEIYYADEWVKVPELVIKLSNATGRNIEANFLSAEDIEEQKTTNPFIFGQLAMRDMAGFTTRDEVSQWGIPLSTFDAFLEREKDRVHETYHGGAQA